MSIAVNAERSKLAQTTKCISTKYLPRPVSSRLRARRAAPPLLMLNKYESARKDSIFSHLFFGSSLAFFLFVARQGVDETRRIRKKKMREIDEKRDENRTKATEKIENDPKCLQKCLLRSTTCTLRTMGTAACTQSSLST